VTNERKKEDMKQIQSLFVCFDSMTRKKKWSNKKKNTHTYIYIRFSLRITTRSKKKSTGNKIDVKVGMVCVYITQEKEIRRCWKISLVQS
jgi:hypothetical protein